MFGAIDVEEPPFGQLQVLTSLAALAAFAALALVIFSVPDGGVGLAEPVEEALPASGIGSQVNAVLINFRAFDTLLEKAVLLVALVGLWGLAPQVSWQVPSGNFVTPGQPEPQLLVLLKVLVPLVLLAAFYLFWLGADEVGGAFQAGTITAALGILLVLGRMSPIPAHGGDFARLGAVAGFVLFAVVGFAMNLLGRGFLDYPEAAAKPIILVIEAGVALSVAVVLFLLAGGLPQYEGER